MKKIISMMLAAVLAVGALGCGPKKETDPTGAETPTMELLPLDQVAGYAEEYLKTELGNGTSGGFVLTNLTTRQASKEFLQELDFNSKETVYFGYRLSELDQMYAGEKYLFTVGEDGKTTTKKYDEFHTAMENGISDILSYGQNMLLLDLEGFIPVDDEAKTRVMINLVAKVAGNDPKTQLLLKALPSIINLAIKAKDGKFDEKVLLEELGKYVKDNSVSLILSGLQLRK